MSTAARPAEPLRRYVAWYTGYRQRGVPPPGTGACRRLPDLIFTLDEPLAIVAHPDRGQPPASSAPCSAACTRSRR